MNLLYYILLGIIALFFLSGIRIINAYEQAVRLRFGKYKDILTEGLNWVIPFVDDLYSTDMRQRTLSLEKQKVLTKDNVNLAIDGVLFYAVENPKNVILNVKNVKSQLSNKATSELKEIIGGMDMNDSLIKREEIAQILCKRLNEAVKDNSSKGEKKDWGVVIKGVQINDISLPEELVRAMSKTAEAERERQARILKATGEQEASQKFAEASKIYADNPIAIRLRELQTYTEIGTEHNSLIIVVPEKQVYDPIALASIGKGMIKENKKSSEDKK